MRLAALVALGVAAYAIFVVATVPASYVAARVQDGSGGAVRVHDPSGSLWRGEARATVATPAGAVAVDRVRWRFAPAALAAGRFAFAMEAEAAGLSLQGEMGRSLWLWEAREARFEGGAAGLAAVVPLIAAWRPEGTVRGTVQRLAWNERELQGEASLEWQGAAVALSPVRPLGHYRAQLRGEGNTARLTVSTLDGALRIAGQGTIAPPMRVDFAGEARAEGPAAPSLQGLLDLMGPRRPDGSREIRWRSAP